MKIQAIVVARMFPVLTLAVWASHVFPGAALGEMVRVFQTITAIRRTPALMGVVFGAKVFTVKASMTARKDNVVHQ